jgi:hypothetical protein
MNYILTEFEVKRLERVLGSILDADDIVGEADFALFTPLMFGRAHRAVNELRKRPIEKPRAPAGLCEQI